VQSRPTGRSLSTVLLVSKPVEPPWNDSSKNLVRDLVLGLDRYDAIALGRKGGPTELGRARIESVYPAGGNFSLGLAEQGRVALRLLTGSRADLWHFFFAPNPKSSAVARLTSGIRRVRTVQSVCSVPRDDVALDRVLFADRIVVLSSHTESRFRDAGIAPERLARIVPAVPKIALPSAEERAATRRAFGLPTDAPVIVYPGDLEFGSGARLTLEALTSLPRDAHLVLACRAKTERARGHELELKNRATELGLAARVTFTGETRQIYELLATADAVALPSEVAYAKMDYPLVLLEAMMLARPVIVCSGTPAAELAASGGAIAVPPDAGALAAELGRWLADADARRVLGERARHVALTDHDQGAMARAYERVYDSLL
jgi:glycosyltransferase involved in cell wall biosynthesis